jgi:LPS-assembly protein
MKRWATYHLLTRRAQPGFGASNGHPFTASLGIAAIAFAAVLAVALMPREAYAQAQTNLEQIIKPPTVDATEPMLLQADEMIYDNDNARITARGNVEIYYGNYTLLADQVIYDRNANTLSAEGNVRMKDPDGAIITSPQLTLTDDFRDGFVDSLKLVTKDETRIVAQSASREAGNVTVFRKGWFTPCKLCKEDHGVFAPARSRTSAIKPRWSSTTRSLISSACLWFGCPTSRPRTRR